MRLKTEIKKSVFQIRYTPSLSFYDSLYKNEELFKQFPHWQTDRLKVVLADFSKKHSLTISHDNITFESDKYKREELDGVVDLISKQVNSFTTPDKIKRLGKRDFCLTPVKISFDELVEILNLKLFTKSFVDLSGKEPKDFQLTIQSKFEDLNYRMVIGPIRDFEVPRFIRFNTENHIDINSNSKYSELAELTENYPKTALFFDIDVSSDLNDKSIIEFYENSANCFKHLSNNIVDYLFEDKIK